MPVAKNSVQDVPAQEGLPLGLLPRILHEGLAQPEWLPCRQRSCAALEGSAYGTGQDRPIERAVARQDPEIEEILHLAVGDPKQHQGPIADKSRQGNKRPQPLDFSWCCGLCRRSSDYVLVEPGGHLNPRPTRINTHIRHFSGVMDTPVIPQ